MNDIIFRVIVPDNKILFKTLMLKGERGLQGTSIVSIEKTQTIGLVDYYTITMNDGSTYEFTVQNGTNSYYDSDFSLVSENAVQNKVITAAINAINAALASIQQYDNALSLSSENAVQNKVVKSAIDSINSAIALLAQYDSALSDSSENAVQNKVVKAALDLKANLTALNNYYNKTEIDAAFNNLGASGVSYNNASSGLSATDTQSAIDELKTGLDGKANSSDVYNKTQIDTALSGKQDSLTFGGQAVTWNDTNVTGGANIKWYYKYGRVVIAHLEFTPKSGRIANGNVICSGLPAPHTNYNCFGDNKQQMYISASGELVWYFPTDTTTLNRWDLNIAYFSAN